LFVLLAALTGCQATHVPDSTLPALSGNDPETQLDFWHTLATKNLVSNDEAFHALLLYMDRTDSAQSYPDRVAALKSRKLLDHNFNQPADAPLTRGTLAVALVNHLNLKTGITIALFSHSDRYATRELEDAQIYPASSPNQIFSGAAFVGVIGATQDYKRGNPADYPAHVMPSEIQGYRPPAPEAPLVASSSLSPSPGTPGEGWDEGDSSHKDDLLHPIFAMLQPDNLSLRPSTTTSTAPAGNRAVITAVEGFVSYRESESAKWKRALKGVELSEQAELRTGPDGAIQLVIEPDQTIAVDRLTTVKLLRIFREGAKAATDIGVKYGRTRYDLEGGGIEHQSTLRSPNATLAVRGTRVSLFDQAPFVPQAISLTGTAEFRGLRKRPVRFGAAGQGKTRVTNDNTNPAALALEDTIIDPILPGARTASEIPLLNNLISTGATVQIDRGSGFRTVSGGSVPTDAQLQPLLPGALNFVLRWTGNTNLDFAVSTPDTPATPGGEFIYPVPGLANAPSGGRTAFDHQGGPNGGIEVVFFPANSPTGIYSLAAPNVGNQTAIATINAYLNGAPVDLFDGQTTVKGPITQTVTPSQPGLVLASVGSDFPTLPGNPLRLTTLKKPIDINNPPKAVMVGPKPPAPTPSKPRRR